MISKRALFATPLLGAVLGGCMSWQPTAPSPSTFIMEERPRVVRLTGPEGDPLIIERPLVVGDSIIAPADRFSSVAISDVRVLEVPRFSSTKTAVMVVAQTSAFVTICALIIELLPTYRGFWF